MQAMRMASRGAVVKVIMGMATMAPPMELTPWTNPPITQEKPSQNNANNFPPPRERIIPFHKERNLSAVKLSFMKNRVLRQGMPCVRLFFSLASKAVSGTPFLQAVGAGACRRSGGQSLPMPGLRKTGRSLRKRLCVSPPPCRDMRKAGRPEKRGKRGVAERVLRRDRQAAAPPPAGALRKRGTRGGRSLAGRGSYAPQGSCRRRARQKAREGRQKRKG